MDSKTPNFPLPSSAKRSEADSKTPAPRSSLAPGLPQNLSIHRFAYDHAVTACAGIGRLVMGDMNLRGILALKTEQHLYASLYLLFVDLRATAEALEYIERRKQAVTGQLEGLKCAPDLFDQWEQRSGDVRCAGCCSWLCNHGCFNGDPGAARALTDGGSELADVFGLDPSTVQRECQRCGFYGLFQDGGETCPHCFLVQ